jgi:hypothetical protein
LFNRCFGFGRRRGEIRNAFGGFGAKSRGRSGDGHRGTQGESGQARSGVTLSVMHLTFSLNGAQRRRRFG